MPDNEESETDSGTQENPDSPSETETPAQDEPSESTGPNESTTTDESSKPENRYGADIDLIRESFLSILAGMVVSPAPLITVALLALYISPSELGAYYFTLASVMVLRRPLDGVVNTFRKRATETGGAIHKYLGWTLIIGFVYLTLLGGGASITSDFIASFVFISAQEITAGAVVLVAISFMLLGARLQDSIGNPSFGGWLLTGRDLFFIPVVILLGAANFSDASVYLYAYAFASFFFGAIGILRAEVNPAKPDSGIWKNGWEYAKWEIPNVLSAHIISKSPTIIAGLALGGVAVGIFESGARPTMLIPFLAIGFADPLLLKISGETSEGNRINSEIVSMINAVSFPPLLLLTILIGVGADSARLLFGSPATEIWLIALIVAVARWAYASRMVLSRSIRGADAPDRVSSVIFTGAILSIILSYAGAVFAGAIGVAVGFLAVQILVALELGRRTTNMFQIATFWEPVSGHLAVSSIITVLLLGAYRFQFGVDSILELAGVSLSATVLFSLLMVTVNYRARWIAREVIKIILDITDTDL